MFDIRNVPVSQADEEDLAGFEAALKSFQNYVGDPIEQIEAVLSRNSNFVLGHLFRAIAYYVTTERRFRKPAATSLGAAEALLGGANERERLMFQAVKQLVEGRWEQACRSFDRVLSRYPTDVLSLQTAHLMDFLRGDALNLRNRPGRVLPDWDPSLPGYSYVLGMQAFGLEESNQYADAERVGRQALAIEPCDAWSVHAVTHVMEMQGRTDEGIEFLRTREGDWAPDNALAFHNWWHLGLLYLEKHEDDQVLGLFDRHIFDPAEDFSMCLLDATAILWRLRLIGVDVGQRFAPLADMWANKQAEELGYYAFNDFHAAVAYVGADRRDALEKLTQGLTQARTAGSTADTMNATVGLPLIRGLEAYAAGDFAGVCDELGAVRDIAHRFGGSHAQRDIINLTLLAAAKRAGRDSLVHYLSNERMSLKPRGVLGTRVLAAACQ